MHHPDEYTENQAEYLAKLLAERLNDPSSVPFYLSLARQYPAGHLFNVLGQVMEIPDEQIRKSRGALFTWMVRNGSGPAQLPPVPENLPVAPADQDFPVLTQPDWPELSDHHD